MPPQTNAIDIFLNGSPRDWVVQAGGVSSILVAPAVALVVSVFWLRRVPLGNWVWALAALPALTAIVEFAVEVHGLAADIGEAWSREWDFAVLFASAYARLFFGSAFSLLFLVIAIARRVAGRGTPSGPNLSGPGSSDPFLAGAPPNPVIHNSNI